MCQRSPSRLSADILAQNVDFLSQFFIFALVLVNLQLGSGGVLQVLGQLAANVVGILLAFFIQVRIVEQRQEIGIVEIASAAIPRCLWASKR